MAMLPQVTPAVHRRAGWERLNGTAEGPKRVLVVEDNPTVRLFIVRALRMAGYDVTEVATGAEALWSADGATFDLVISDLSLPDTTGPKLVNVLRGRALPGVSALFISGHFEEEAEESGLLPVGAPFLGKPFTPAALLDVVGEMVA